MSAAIGDKFRSLEIERIQWGDDKGKLTAKLRVEGRSVDMTVRLADGVADRLLKAVGDEIARAAFDQAQEFRHEFIMSLNPAPEASK